MSTPSTFDPFAASKDSQNSANGDCLTVVQVSKSGSPLWRSPSAGRTTMSTSITLTPWAGASSDCTARWRIALVTMIPTTPAQSGILLKSNQ